MNTKMGLPGPADASGSPESPPDGQAAPDPAPPGSHTPTAPMPTLEPGNVPAGTPAPGVDPAPTSAAAASNAPTAPPPAPAAAPVSDVPPGAGFIRVRLFGRTDVGRIREHNEDNFLVADLSQNARGLMENIRTHTVGAQGTLFAVCDGMGGAAAGEVASKLAVDIIYEQMQAGGPPRHRDELARRLVRAVEVAGLRIFAEAKLDRNRRGMGTTATAAALLDDHLFLAQVGDSRGYLLRATSSSWSRAISRSSTSSSKPASSPKKKPRTSSTPTSSCRRSAPPTASRSTSPT